jgi:competence protein ComEA
MFKKLLAFFAAMTVAVAFAAVDVNKATPAELDGIKGIGPSISAKIVDERKKGNFKSWEDFIERVKGIGEGNAAKFSAEGLTVGGAGYKGAAAAPAKKDDKPAAPAAAKVDAKPAAAPAAPAKADAKPVAAAAAAAPAAKEEKKDPKADAKAKKEAEAKAKADEAKAKKEADAKAKADAKAAKDKPAAKSDAKADAAKPAASAAKK